MAERRMISKSISVSEKVNEMSTFAKLLYTWMIPHSDDFGRLPGSPIKVKALVVPMAEETKKDVASALKEMVNQKLIEWYEVDGSMYIQLCSFEKHQSGLHKRTASKYPSPFTESIDDNIKGLSASESDVEELITLALERNEFIKGDNIINVDRQLRVNNSYLDIVAVGDSGKQYLFEVKRQRLSNASINQILKYRNMLNGQVECLLIGYGLSSNFDLGKARKEKINVIIFDDHLKLESVLLFDVNHCQLTLNNNDSRYPTLPAEQNRTEENRTELQEPSASNDDVVPNNRDLIAELVDKYRAIKKVRSTKGDYSFVGKLYNEFGYADVLEAISSLESKMILERIEKPLLYLNGILKNSIGKKNNVTPFPVKQEGVRVNMPSSADEQKRLSVEEEMRKVKEERMRKRKEAELNGTGTSI